jgi:hypothetical protein
MMAVNIDRRAGYFLIATIWNVIRIDFEGALIAAWAVGIDAIYIYSATNITIAAPFYSARSRTAGGSTVRDSGNLFRRGAGLSLR